MENEIPFPLLSGQYIKYDGSFYQIQMQGTIYDLTKTYAIPPGGELSGQSITMPTNSSFNVFQTPVNGLYEWVTWVDNEYLGVSWKVLNRSVNDLRSYAEYLTKQTSPFGSVNMPMFILNNTSGSVSLTLTNLSSVKIISGTLHIIMYAYMTKQTSETPQAYTDISYAAGDTK